LGRSAPIRSGDPKTAVKHLDCAPACHQHPLESSRRAPARSLYNFNSFRVPQSGLGCKFLPLPPHCGPLQPSDPNKARFQPQPEGPVEAGGEVENQALRARSDDQPAVPWVVAIHALIGQIRDQLPLTRSNLLFDQVVQLTLGQGLSVVV